MGTNYYLTRDTCPCCGQSPFRIHIGKSSVGWAFALHIIPRAGINGLEDWKSLWLWSDMQIVDEYGRELEPEQMARVITERSHPNGLKRAEVDHVTCIANSRHTYDYIIGDFS